MDKIYTFMPKKTFFLIISLLIGIIIILLITSLNKTKKDTTQPEPVISQSPSSITPLQKTVSGKTTAQDIEQAYTIINKQSVPNNEIRYTIKSNLIARPNEVIFHNNTAQFERTVILGDATESVRLKISDQTLRYGLAEKTIKGSIYYGKQMNTYIYASKGFAFIANPNADEIYELQTFIPTTVEEYLSKYGEDIKEYGEIRE